jgi:hypothetical protein
VKSVSGHKLASIMLRAVDHVLAIHEYGPAAAATALHALSTVSVLDETTVSAAAATVMAVHECQSNSVPTSRRASIFTHTYNVSFPLFETVRGNQIWRRLKTLCGRCGQSSLRRQGCLRRHSPRSCQLRACYARRQLLNVTYLQPT